MAGKIFISYRRSGSPKDANMVFSHLSSVFGPEHIFMDVSGIRPGDDFVEVLERQLADCTVLLALIGPDWLQARNEYGERKLDDEDDFVRVEIRTALQRRMRVVPLLLDGAPMPRRVDLPEDLHPMVRRQGLPVDATHLHHFRSAMGRLEVVLQEALSVPALAAAAPPPVAASRAAWMSAEGHDEYGRWAELRVNGVVQRLRWIEPGEFWMGSTEAERKHFSLSDDFDDESPRHQVKLTHGFWLADTACTQALWQTVVGDNPSHFTGDLQLPVEKVSWDDVTKKFLSALNRQLVGAEALLPTEAQWEYACRAGTETAYHFGEQIHSDQVNYDGNHPPPGGRTGEYREKTVPVKALPANAWGLYQMHGNVWEWCADAPRSYGDAPVLDPDGGRRSADRALRGGSWDREAWEVRCAFRNTSFHDLDDPDESDIRNEIGFRFALKSIEAGAGGR